MASPYKRTSTPMITFVERTGMWAVFRLHLRGEEGLNALLFRQDVGEFLLKEMITHKMGNVIPGFTLPENPKRADFFVAVGHDEAAQFVAAFEVTGAHPYMLTETVRL